MKLLELPEGTAGLEFQPSERDGMIEGPIDPERGRAA